MKTVAITGANGFLGTKLIKLILNETDYNIVGIASHEEKIENALKQENIDISDRIKFVSNQSFLDDEFRFENVDDFFHLAFSRRNRSNEEIAASMDFAAAVFSKVQKSDVNRIVYLSSQSVYGNTSEIRTELTAPAPATVYATSKYATEKIFEACFRNASIETTSIRLDPVIQSQNVVRALCRQAKYDGVIKLKGGEQRFSYIDIEDAVRALLCLIRYNGPWKKVYNVGLNNGRLTLIQLADYIAGYAQKATGNQVKIELDKQEIELWSGMDASLFMRDTGWEPRYGIEDMIAHVFDNE